MIHEIRDVIELNCVFFSLGIEKILRSLMTCGEHSAAQKRSTRKKTPTLCCMLFDRIRADAKLPWITHIYAYYPNFAVKPPFHIYILIPMHKINLIQTYFSVELNRNAATTVPHGFNLNLHKRKCFNQTKQRVHSLNKAEKSHNF